MNRPEQQSNSRYPLKNKDSHFIELEFRKGLFTEYVAGVLQTEVERTKKRYEKDGFEFIATHQSKT